MQPTEHVQSHGGLDDHLRARVRAEFLEMPGLRLTIWQAARLFNLDADNCERVLAALVESGTLSAAGGAFMRADSGRRQA
jgi:hypothetical protein